MVMKTVDVNTGHKYSVIIERGLLKNAGKLIGEISKAKKVAVITDTTVSKLYASTLLDSLVEAGFEPFLYDFGAGETSKNHNTLLEIYSFLVRCDFNRSSLIIALGGGVVGDVAGYAAATYMRGIQFVQIPTTLLAQIDSSVGGKTGVDLNEGKNLVGAFWQPELVICDPDVLSTLSPRIFADGMAEAIKYGCIRNSTLFDEINNNSYDIENLIETCVDIKRDVVQNDEREAGERMLLNFGHTLGHAIEVLGGYSNFSHGEAIGLGMLMMSKSSEKHSLTESGTTAKIEAILKQNNLPTECIYKPKDIQATAIHDKKRAGSKLNIILIKKIGEGFIHTINANELIDFLFYCN
jgi:3-dehydroquinate synthase